MESATALSRSSERTEETFSMRGRREQTNNRDLTESFIFKNVHVSAPSCMEIVDKLILPRAESW